MIDNFKTLDKLINFWVVNKMPKDQVLYCDADSSKKINEWLGSLGSSGVTGAVLNINGNETGIVTQRLQYAGFVINIVDIDTLP